LKNMKIWNVFKGKHKEIIPRGSTPWYYLFFIIPFI
jgi:hypothetical protein